MTAHKYLSIVYQWQLLDHHISGMILTSWILPFALVLPFGLSSSASEIYGIQASGNYCMNAMHSENVVNLISTALVMVFIIGTILFLVHAHIHIFVKYKQLTKAKRMVHNDADTKRAIKNESILIKKSVAIAGLFAFSWSFYLFQMMYELTTHTQVPPEYDVFWECLGTIIPMLNLLILYIYDAKFKQNILELFVLNTGTAVGRVITWTRRITKTKTQPPAVPQSVPPPPNVKILVMPQKDRDVSTIQLKSFDMT